jgi:hypothetical protein
MIGRLVDTLARLIEDVATTDRAADLVPRWGVAAESLARPDGIRVECEVPSPFEALEIRPWDEDGYGLVDIELRAGAPVPWAAVRDRFGPFEEATTTVGLGPELVARQPAMGDVSTTLIVEVEDDQVLAITIRRDRVPA